MKNLLFLTLALITLTFHSKAQTPVNEQRKSIHVVGSSEMEITPDEIYFTIILEEYMEDKVKKTTIEKLEKDLQESVGAAGIPKENLTIQNIYGENWQYKRKKTKDYLEKKSYQLKLNEPSKIDQVLDKLDQKAIENVYISKLWHSKMEEFRKQLKIDAIKNAKEKAKYLLEAIGEQMGPALQISEIENGVGIGGFYMDENQISNNAYRSYGKMASANYSENSSVEIKKIKLRFEISAEFAIK